jgi:hypothetical protein
MENLDDRDAGCFGAINQSLLALDEGWHVFLDPIRAVAKGFLHIDDDQGGIRGGHLYLHE